MADETTKDDARDSTVVFEMSGRTVVLDVDPAKMMGVDAMLVDDHAGSHDAWILRMLQGEPTARDLLLLGYIGAKRDNARLEWSHYVRSVAPWSMRIVSIAGIPLSRRDEQRGDDQADDEPADDPAPPKRTPSRARKAPAPREAAAG